METVIQVMDYIGMFVWVCYGMNYSMVWLRDKIKDKDTKDTLEITRRILFTRWY